MCLFSDLPSPQRLYSRNDRADELPTAVHHQRGMSYTCHLYKIEPVACHISRKSITFAKDVESNSTSKKQENGWHQHHHSKR